MRITLILLFLTFLCTCVRAQVDNFQPASITLTSGETRTGWVSAEASRSLSKRVRFRPEKNDRDGEQRYSPSELNALEFTESGRKFLSIAFRWTPVGDTEEQTEPRLAEVLYDGVYDLVTLDRATGEYFVQNNEVSPQVYYLISDSAAEPLEVVQRQLEGSSESKYVVVEAYKGKLRYYFQDWPKAESALRQVRFDDNSLIRIFDAYTQFNNPAEAKTKLGKQRVPLQLSPRIIYAPEHRFASTEGANKAAMGLGFFLRRPINRSSGLMEIEFGVEALRLGFAAGPQRNNATVFENVLMLRLPVYGDFYLSKQSAIKPRGRIGGNISLAAVRGISQSFLRFGEFQDLTFDYGLYGGLGVDVKRLTLDLGYDTRLGLVFGLGYRLGN